MKNFIKISNIRVYPKYLNGKNATEEFNSDYAIVRKSEAIENATDFLEAKSEIIALQTEKNSLQSEIQDYRIATIGLGLGLAAAIITIMYIC